VKKNLLIGCLLALCSVPLSGQIVRPFRVVHNVDKSAVHVPPPEVPASLKTIYSNLGKGTDVYNAIEGWLLAGPNSVYGVNSQEFIALPFTPKSNAHVSELRAGLQYDTGPNQVNLSLYSDTNGAPGALLAGPVTVTNLPAYGTCCTVAIADFTPVPVTAGTKYWVVADTPLSGTGSDSSAAWEWVGKASVQWAQDFNDFGWNLTPSDALPAGQVLGTIP